MTEKIPITFQLGDKLIDGATINPVSFSKFSEYVTEAWGMKVPKTFEARLRRIRLAKQVTYHINGSTTPVGMEDVMRMPILAARAITTQLEADEAKVGKVIRAGDGIDKAIGYQLGTPIPTGQGKPPITELEFLAATYGDVEDVLAGTDGLSQTAQLIASVAKPVHTSLQVLPSWAVDQITISDGFTIMREVLPHFLGRDVE